VVADQEIIRDVLADLSVNLRLQQERLGQDAMHGAVEVGEGQPRQFKARLIDYVVTHGRAPVQAE
jgi:hypothetical protein